MLVRNCPKLSAIHVFGNENQSMKISLLKNMPPQTRTDTTFILTSERFPGSFSDLNSRLTIGCQPNTSQAIGVIYDFFYRKMQVCESMDLCAVSFDIILSFILINIVVKVFELCVHRDN